MCVHTQCVCVHMCMHMHIHCLFKAFIIEEYWILSKVYSASIEVIMWFFVLESIYVIYYIYGFEQVEPCTFGMPSTLLQYRIFLYVLEFSLRVLYWEILHLSSSKRIVYNFLFVFVVSLCDFDVRVTLSSLRVWCWP